MVDKVTVEKFKKSPRADETDGFKFAVALIIAFSTAVNTIYYYVNNNPVNNYLCIILNVLIPISLTILGLIAYIIVKGISLEIINPKMKEQLEKTSTMIYISTFMLFVFYIIMEICTFIFNKYLMHYIDSDGLIVAKVILTMLIFYSLFYTFFHKSLNFNYFKKSLPYTIVVCLGTTIVVFFGSLVSPYLLAGDIKVEMDDVYCTNDTHIPIYIVNTGYNGNITVNLSEIHTEDNVSATLDSIELHADGSKENTNGKYLFSNTLSYGKYKVFINATSLTQGYYQLSFSEESQKSQWTPVIEKIFPIIHQNYNVFYFGNN